MSNHTWMLWGHIHLKSPMELLKDKIKLEEFERRLEPFFAVFGELQKGWLTRGLAQHKVLDFRSSHIIYLGGGFIFFYFRLYIFGEDVQFDYVFFGWVETTNQLWCWGWCNGTCKLQGFVSTSLQRWNHGTNLAPAVVYENLLNMMILLKSSQWQGYHQQYI